MESLSPGVPELKTKNGRAAAHTPRPATDVERQPMCPPFAETLDRDLFLRSVALLVRPELKGPG